MAFHAGIRAWRRLGIRRFEIAAPTWLTFPLGIIIGRHARFARRLKRTPVTWAISGVLILLASWLDAQTWHAFGWRPLVSLTELKPKPRLRGVIRAGVSARVRHPGYSLYTLLVLSMAFLTGPPAIFCWHF